MPSLIFCREDTWREPRWNGLRTYHSHGSLSAFIRKGGCSLSWVSQWLVVVEISATLFQPARSGSHLYSAPLHPVRSRTLSSRSYSPLVGLATPLLPCIPHLYLDYTTLLAVCQALFLTLLRPSALPRSVRYLFPT